jgi:hypothetical protein
MEIQYPISDRLETELTETGSFTFYISFALYTKIISDALLKCALGLLRDKVAAIMGKEQELQYALGAIDILLFRILNSRFNPSTVC